MKPKYAYFLVFIILALLAVVLVWKYTFRKSEPNVASQKTDVEIQAVKLVEAFETDENAANSLYLDKIITVSGNIESVTEDSLGISVYLKESGAMAGVICSFEKNSIDTSLITKGLQVNIKGICSGYLMDVVLNKCSLEP
jgi:hypothetical protein